MLKKIWLLIWVIVLLALPLTSAMAQEDTTNNYTCEDIETCDNWCFGPNGLWADGRCNAGSPEKSQWHWVCGWLMARFDRGELSREAIANSMCAPLLPPLPELATTVNRFFGRCLDSSSGTDVDVRYRGLDAKGTAAFYHSLDGSCTSFWVNDSVVTADSQQTANAKCAAWGQSVYENAAAHGYPVPGNYWHCD